MIVSYTEIISHINQAISQYAEWRWTGGKWTRWQGKMQIIHTVYIPDQDHREAPGVSID
jgi:hypothetical protein